MLKPPDNGPRHIGDILPDVMNRIAIRACLAGSSLPTEGDGAVQKEDSAARQCRGASKFRGGPEVIPTPSGPADHRGKAGDSTPVTSNIRPESAGVNPGGGAGVRTHSPDDDPVSRVPERLRAVGGLMVVWWHRLHAEDFGAAASARARLADLGVNVGFTPSEEGAL